MCSMVAFPVSAITGLLVLAYGLYCKVPDSLFVSLDRRDYLFHFLVVKHGCLYPHKKEMGAYV